MRKRLAQSLILLSLLLCLATTILWIRSHFTLDTITTHTLDHDCCLVSCDGLCAISIDQFSAINKTEWTSQKLSDLHIDGIPISLLLHGLDTMNPDHQFHFANLEFAHGSRIDNPLISDSSIHPTRHPAWNITFPYWMLAPLFTLLPLRQLILLIKRRRQKHLRVKRHHCPTCNYDLRAHAPNSNCPECGTPVPQPKSTPQTPQPPSRNPQESSP